MSYLILDLETGSKESYLRKGNPFDPKNKIVALGLKPQGEEAETYYLRDTNIINGFKFLQGNTCNVLVGHNIKFDLLYLWKYSQLQDWLVNGGRIYDTQVGEYILTGQRHKYPALRDIAVNKYGCQERPKHMEEYWDKGIDTSEIPAELVLEDVKNDVLDTEKVMLQQIKLLKEQGMWKLTQSLMDSILSTTEMEYNGLFINQQVFQENKGKILSKIESIKQELDILTRRYWHE